MPTRKEVQQVLLRTLLRHGGTIKEFGAGEEIVREMADEFELNASQRAAYLETIYRKQNRVKKAFLWHRLLFRAADALAQEQMVSRPTQTLQLTNRREWMLTEKGFDEALKLCNIPVSKKSLCRRSPTRFRKLSKSSSSRPSQKTTIRLIETKKSSRRRENLRCGTEHSVKRLSKPTAIVALFAG